MIMLTCVVYARTIPESSRKLPCITHTREHILDTPNSRLQTDGQTDPSLPIWTFHGRMWKVFQTIFYEWTEMPFKLRCGWKTNAKRKMWRRTTFWLILQFKMSLTLAQSKKTDNLKLFCKAALVWLHCTWAAKFFKALHGHYWKIE